MKFSRLALTALASHRPYVRHNMALATGTSAMSTCSSNTNNNNNNNSNMLAQARALQVPSRDAVLRRDMSVYDFWNTNEALLEDAWKEWQETDPVAKTLPPLDASLIHPTVRQAVEAIWIIKENHDVNKETSDDDTIMAEQIESLEQTLKGLWKEVAPGVYAAQFLDLSQIHKLQAWFEAAAESGIPVRPPYGIVLNRKGFMMDERSVGFWAAPAIQEFYQRILMDQYIRPLGRVFFPDSIIESDDNGSFAFSIQYQVGGDESIRHHTDASTMTFNLNLDDEKTWTGSYLYFWETLNGGKRFTVEWEPGMAVMHLGKTLHAAVPIESGTRSNWVIWTTPRKGGLGSYGSSPLTDGQGKYPPEYQLSPEQRWTKVPPPTEKPYDRWSPF